MHLSIWARSGHKEIRRWTEPVISGHKGKPPAAVGTGYFVEYLDTKGKKQSCMMRVQWKSTWPDIGAE